MTSHATIVDCMACGSDIVHPSPAVHQACYEGLKKERDEMLAALRRIVDEGGCTCTGYYKCNGCENRAVHIAEDAIEKLEAGSYGLDAVLKGQKEE